MTPLKILAIPGSLRTNSSSHKIIGVVASLAPVDVAITVYNELGILPHFDGSEEVPVSVKRLLDQIRDSEGVLICTPEYAYGVPGSLKNALDWTVGDGSFYDKPTAYITAATGGEKAHESLGFTLVAMNASVPEKGKLLISAVRAKLDANGNFKDATLEDKVKDVIQSLVDQISALGKDSA